jgi:tetratricopeptide (TPR) repeat protein
MIQLPPDLPDDQIEVWQQAVESFYQANRLQRQGDWAGAIRAFRHSIHLYPTPEAYTHLGWVYSLLHLYDDAISACRQALELDPGFGNPANDIGAYLIELNRHREALPWLEQALAAPRFEGRAQAYVNRGRVYEALGDWLTAAENYQTALDLAADNQPARKALHNIRSRLN